MMLEQTRRHAALLYIVAINCLLYVLYMKPRSWTPPMTAFLVQQEWQDFEKDYFSRFQRRTPKGMKAWWKHARQHRCETRDYYEPMDQDLSYFRRQKAANGTSLLHWGQVIPEAAKITGHYMAFQLENHKLTLVKFQAHDGKVWEEKPIEKLIRKLLKPVIQHSPPLKSTFVFNLHDAALESSVHAKYPLFSVCKMDYYTNDQPIPTGNTTSVSSFKSTYKPGPGYWHSKDLLVPWWYNLRFQSTKLWFWPLLNKGFSFSRRKNAITWRGSTTGAWETGPRFQLVRQYGWLDKLRNNHTKTNVDADFAFIRIVQKGGNLKPKTYRFARHQFYWEMQLRKYIMDVDGNGFTSRFPGLLRSGSLVFKSTRYREWFHGIVKPFEDYIPVNHDLTDLVTKVAWAEAHPQESQQIVDRSRQQVENHIRVEDMQCYMYRLMLEYQTLFEPL